MTSIQNAYAELEIAEAEISLQTNFQKIQYILII